MKGKTYQRFGLRNWTNFKLTDQSGEWILLGSSHQPYKEKQLISNSGPIMSPNPRENWHQREAGLQIESLNLQASDYLKQAEWIQFPSFIKLIRSPLCLYLTNRSIWPQTTLYICLNSQLPQTNSMLNPPNSNDLKLI